MRLNRQFKNMSDVPLREFRFEVRGVLGMRDSIEKAEEMLRGVLRDWVKEVDGVEIFPVYNG